MPDLLLELFSEEIPARMQRRAAEDLRKLVTDALVERGFGYEGARAAATPRRLALHVAGLPVKGEDVREQRKGPRVGAPEAALQGFLKSAGVVSVDQVKIQSDPKKGDFYVALIERPGRPTPEILAEILPEIVRTFPWPKSMRWGPASRAPGSLRWVRPLQSIVCTFGPETEEPEVVRFEVDGIASGDMTRGHRFMAPDPVRVRRFADYAAALDRAKVVLDPDRRRDIILHDARDLAFAQGLELVEDEGLLEEVTGLVEWPVVLMGAFEESFLAIPPEVIRATIRANQKCFVLRSPSSPGEGRDGGAGAVDADTTPSSRPSHGPGGQDGSEDRNAAPSGALAEPGETNPVPSPQGEPRALANRFILVSNLIADDGGRAIVAGNERVVRARLSDAKFFWEQDQKVRLEDRLEKLATIVFHEKLGTQAERVERIAALARELAGLVGADPELASRAARLAKADLVTEMVGEFPELQGLMGRYYAALQGEHPSVVAAIEEHYKPLGPSDRVPADPVSVTVALADKIDTLVGFWAIGEKPTGSKDPYALRRAALGVIRLILGNRLRIPIAKAILGALRFSLVHANVAEQRRLGALAPSEHDGRAERFAELAAAAQELESRIEAGSGPQAEEAPIVADLLAFLADRLKVYLRDRQARHDLIDAVFALGATHPVIPGEPKAREGDPGTPPRSGSPSPAPTASAPAGDDNGGQDLSRQDLPVQDDLLMIVRRVEALGRFLDTEDGQNLLTGFRRAANILRIEEKKEGGSYDEPPDLALIAERGQIEEKALAVALAKASQEAREAVAREDFEGAMLALSRLRGPVDAFFDKVTVNTEDPEMRANRLKLLNAIRAATREVADFSRIEG